ncbi:ATP-dependent RNA helicase SUV3 [Reticulomyxa filosa]|uniref:ATP-dependent RNA helicase SUV3 n=1 Tax=Reticulomyxa filosa TaxID=46433 RepID=X6NAD5_RETFI|nr:ATP-dependent RNA helicase SUV3 [Reticulomyxa filosa]|eukprot:ETO22858.1 ATP-dependent RNA helicase SUV3 [Reticulomyxa filosa]
MGLNLNINRVIFSTLTKRVKWVDVPLTVSEILQIGGRAGRFGLYNEGYVTCMNKEDHTTLKEIFETNMRPPIGRRATLYPEKSHVHYVCENFPWLKFDDVLRSFVNPKQIDKDMEFSTPEMLEMISIASAIRDIPLSADDKYTFCSAPMRENNLDTLSFIQKWAVLVSQDQFVPLELDESTLAHLDLGKVETFHSIIQSYNYLRWRFPLFVDGHKCEHLLNKCAQIIQDEFDTLTLSNKEEYFRNTNLGTAVSDA